MTYAVCSITQRAHAARLWFLKEIEESGGLSGTSQPAAWRSRPVVGDFGKEAHFSSMATGAGGDIDAR
jgi:hypothetical protein